MKKLVIISLGLSMLFLAWCKNTISSTENVTTSNGINTNDSFNKKKECAEQYNQMKSYIEDQHNWDDEDGSKNSFIEEIFYSNKLNTCVVLVKYYQSTSMVSSFGKFAIDFFTKKQVWYKEDSCREKDSDSGKWKDCINTQDNILLDSQLEAIRN